MDDDEKKQLANLLIPHLAWELSRSVVFNYQPDENSSGASAELFLDQITQHIRRKLHDGESFAVAIIPVRNVGEGR